VSCVMCSADSMEQQKVDMIALNKCFAMKPSNVVLGQDMRRQCILLCVKYDSRLKVYISVLKNAFPWFISYMAPTSCLV